MGKPMNNVCADCGAKFSRPSRLENHIRTHTGERPFVCSYEDCNNSYARMAHLTRHEATHNIETLKCTYEGCSVTVTRAEALRKHIANKHLNKTPKTYQCQHCNQSFNKHSWLKTHETQHTGLQPYVCPESGCDMRFPVPCKLKRHMKMHQGYPCSFKGCGVVSRTWTNNMRHQQIHSKSFSCDTCSKVFSNSSNLRAHKKIHLQLSERPGFACAVKNCNRFYTEEKNLRYHVQRYHDQRPFNCTYDGCALSFKTQEKLDNHEDIHDSDKSASSKKKKKQLKKKRKLKWKLAATLAGYKNEEGLVSESDNSDEQTEKLSNNKAKANKEAAEDLRSHESSTHESSDLPETSCSASPTDNEGKLLKNPKDDSCTSICIDDEMKSKDKTKPDQQVGKELLTVNSSMNIDTSLPLADSVNDQIDEGDESVFEDDSAQEYDKSDMVLHTVLVTLNP